MYVAFYWYAVDTEPGSAAISRTQSGDEWVPPENRISWADDKRRKEVALEVCSLVSQRVQMHGKTRLEKLTFITTTTGRTPDPLPIGTTVQPLGQISLVQEWLLKEPTVSGVVPSGTSVFLAFQHPFVPRLAVIFASGSTLYETVR